MYLSVGASLKASGCGCNSPGVAAAMVVRSSATSQEARGEPASDAEPPRMPRRKVKPRVKWSKGDAPGEYGGPPIDLQIRPSWGGGRKEDPLTATDDYIWKKAWRPFVETAPGDVQPPPPPVFPTPSHLFPLPHISHLPRIRVSGFTCSQLSNQYSLQLLYEWIFSLTGTKL